MLSVLSCVQCSAQVYRMRSVSISAILQGHAEHFHETVWSGFQVAKHNTRRTRTWDMRAYFLWIAEKQHVYPIPPIHSCHLKWPTDLPLQWNCLTSRIMPANAHCPAFRQQLVTKPNAELRKDIGCRVVAFASRAHRHHQEGSKWNWTPWEVLGSLGKSWEARGTSRMSRMSRAGNRGETWKKKWEKPESCQSCSHAVMPAKSAQMPSIYPIYISFSFQ